MKIYGKSDTDLSEIAKKNKRLLKRAMVEAQKLVDGTSNFGEGSTGFYSQRMNIDPIWLTFFVAKYYAQVTVDQFYVWQRSIWITCQHQLGSMAAQRTLEYAQSLNIPGVDKVLAHISVNTDIYLPPWILNYNRIYDIAAVIAPFDCGNIEKTTLSPAISWRYFLSLDFRNHVGSLNFITSLWNMEKMNNEGTGDQDIRLSERILHQIIMGRNSPLCNTNTVSGNALNVKIVE